MYIDIRVCINLLIIIDPYIQNFCIVLSTAQFAQSSARSNKQAELLVACVHASRSLFIEGNLMICNVACCTCMSDYKSELDLISYLSSRIHVFSHVTLPLLVL